MITIVIPIIKFNDYSHKVMSELGATSIHYDGLKFLFAVSDANIAEVLNGYLKNFPNEHEVYVANNYSSNFLRSFCQKATTSHVYFQDCDDYVDYELINKYSKEDLPTDRVLCFNVTKRFYNESAEIMRESTLFKIKEGTIEDIEILPTCVYSKIIPVDLLRAIDFPNLPYSQDWAISYQLFFIGRHIFVNKSTYIYNNYPSSSSAKRFAKLYGTNRVNVFGRLLCNRAKQCGLVYESDILKYKYADMLTDVYNSMGVPFLRIHLSARMIVNHFRLKACAGYIYHTLRSVSLFLKTVSRHKGSTNRSK